MSNLNWATAPIDATHGGNSPYERGVVTWFKDVGHGNHSFLNDGSMQSWHKGSGNLSQWSLVERPKPWSGPEDGLPKSEWCSVGKMVQVMSLPTHHHEDVSIYLSKPSKIVASYTDDDGDSFLMLRIDCDFGTGYECFAAHRVLPAKTEKQIAAEKRETAIREIMDVADVDCRVTAARLVDAGFKREVV